LGISPLAAGRHLLARTHLADAAFGNSLPVVPARLDMSLALVRACQRPLKLSDLPAHLLELRLRTGSVVPRTYRRVMNLLVDQSGRPSPTAKYASHVLVGVAAAAVVGKYRGPEAALMAFVVVALAHHYFDAPVAVALVTTLA
jgi:hypothetical protein